MCLVPLTNFSLSCDPIKRTKRFWEQNVIEMISRLSNKWPTGHVPSTNRLMDTSRRSSWGPAELDVALCRSHPLLPQPTHEKLSIYADGFMSLFCCIPLQQKRDKHKDDGRTKHLLKVSLDRTGPAESWAAAGHENNPQRRSHRITLVLSK